jgi:hypothetical protein
MSVPLVLGLPCSNYFYTMSMMKRVPDVLDIVINTA